MVYNGVNHSKLFTFIEKVGMFDATSNAEQQNIPSRQSCEVKMVRQKLFAILVRAISVIYDHFSIEKVNLETSDIHICPRKIVGKIFVHIGQTSSISRLIDSLSQFQEFCRSNPEICYPWTV